MIYNFTIYPLEVIYKALYLFISNLVGSYGISLILLSIITTLLILPFMRIANKMQDSEKHIQDVMAPQFKKIKTESTGAEQHKRIKKLYHQYAYHPVMAVRSAAGVALQIPFLMAAYFMLSSLPNIQGESFLFINDLSKPDALISGINLLPILMTAVNLLSAWTTPSFAKKDKIQAIVIAFLFLLLLYNAPSALLIFWTFNNLWVLFVNLWTIIARKVGFTHSRLTIKRKKISEWLAAVNYKTYVILALTTTFCVFIPIDIYIRNSNEFWFSINDIIGILILSCVLSSVILSAITYLLKGKARSIFIYLLLGLTLGFFMQSYIINIDYGVLDGRQIDWSSYRKQGIINAFFWAVCFAFPFVLSRITSSALKFRKTVTRISCGLILVQICTVIFLFSTTPIVIGKNETYLSTEKIFELSSKNNLIIFILDTFESKEFKRIIKEHPALEEPLDGFVYYPDSVGSYPTTIGALPQILTGKWYEHKDTYDEYLKKSWGKNKFWQYLHDENYDCRVFSFENFVSKTAQIENLVQDNTKISSHYDLSKEYYKLTAFRSTPHFLKKFFLLYADVFYSYRTDNIYSAFDDVKFYEQLCTEGVTIQDSANCFRFYHLQGPHGPWTMTRDIKRDKSGTVTHDDQAIASLKIVNTYISKLKTLNLYENSAIVIMSDHGNHSGEAVVRSPLVLIKEKNATGTLKKSNNPISYENLLATFAACVDNKSVGLFGVPFMVSQTNPEPRRFLSYIWDIAPPKEDVVPFLEEYLVVGDASNPESWHKTQIIYGARQKPHDITYKLGKPISFLSNGNSINYIPDPFSGWSTPEANFTWTDGDKAILSLDAHNAKNMNLNLRLKIFPYLGGKLENQTVDVFVNNTKIATWNVTTEKWYEAKIPASVNPDGKLKIEFAISDPISPKEVGASEDSRKLGIAAKELIIIETK